MLIEATVEDGVWTCRDAALLALLRLVSLPDGYYPWPGLALVERAADLLVGTVRDHDKLEPPDDDVPGRVY